MRGYYYDQDGPRPTLRPGPPARPQARPGRRGGGRAVVLFLCTLLLLVGTAVLLRMWDAARMREELRFQQGGRQTWEEQKDDWAEEQTPPAEVTTVERAPTGDGTTLSIVPAGGEAPHSFQQIYQENISSIVSIRGTSQEGLFFGTGVLMTDDGYLITNAHVIEGCSRVEAVLQDERVYPALLVGYDVQTDLAVLKIDAGVLTPAEFGDSAALQVGDTVLAIGNPLGEELRGTMTDGIISAINRDVYVDGYTMVLLQTTAALNSGNSGGALINQYGQVVGITNLKMESYDSTVEGLGFAIPTATVKSVVDELIAHGVVTGRPTIGITVRAVSAYGSMPAGVRVESVQTGSDAEGKLEVGDIITLANGTPVTTTDELLAVKEQLSAGDVLALRFWREGLWLEADVALVEQYTLEG
ncbi:S1C family serine protease [uncultured Flavonifractor sp.]|uniref:S1C family serine protease n=1 Tax=uncultured Flavonifractor sp. TaxID=1193534 RepID=UPI00263729F2|nr:S1C family serine protease [uncultured Flavonifractor sp.]